MGDVSSVMQGGRRGGASFLRWRAAGCLERLLDTQPPTVLVATVVRLRSCSVILHELFLSSARRCMQSSQMPRLLLRKKRIEWIESKKDHLFRRAACAQQRSVANRCSLCSSRETDEKVSVSRSPRKC